MTVAKQVGVQVRTLVGLAVLVAALGGLAAWLVWDPGSAESGSDHTSQPSQLTRSDPATPAPRQQGDTPAQIGTPVTVDQSPAVAESALMARRAALQAGAVTLKPPGSDAASSSVEPHLLPPGERERIVASRVAK